MVPKLSGSRNYPFYPHAGTMFQSHPCKVQDRSAVKGFSFVSPI